MSKKRIFPDDWSKMSDTEIAENIKYLQRNYKKYNVSASGNSVYLDNVHIYTYAKTKDGRDWALQTQEPWIIKDINNKEIRNDNLLYPELSMLYKDCVKYTLSPCAKCKDWIKNNCNLLIGTALGVKIGLTIGMFVGYASSKQFDNQSRADSKIQTSVPENSATKTISFTDSVKTR